MLEGWDNVYTHSESRCFPTNKIHYRVGQSGLKCLTVEEAQKRKPVVNAELAGVPCLDDK